MLRVSRRPDRRPPVRAPARAGARAPHRRDPERASYVLDEALSLWRGRALADLEDWEPGRTEAERLDGLRMDAQELRVEAEIAAGRARASLEGRGRWSERRRYRERRWALFARALYQSGRQTEALDVLGAGQADAARGARTRPRRRAARARGGDPAPGSRARERGVAARQPRLPVPRAAARTRATDAETFFGREADVDACLTRLRDPGDARRRRPVGHRQVVARPGRRRRHPRARGVARPGDHAGEPAARLPGGRCRRGRRSPCWSSTRARKRSPCAATRPSGRRTSTPSRRTAGRW